MMKRLLGLIVFLILMCVLWLIFYNNTVNTVQIGRAENAQRLVALNAKISNTSEAISIIKEVPPSNEKKIQATVMQYQPELYGKIKAYFKVPQMSFSTSKSYVLNELNKQQEALMQNKVERESKTFWDFLPPVSVIILSAISIFLSRLIILLTDELFNWASTKRVIKE